MPSRDGKEEARDRGAALRARAQGRRRLLGDGPRARLVRGLRAAARADPRTSSPRTSLRTPSTCSSATSSSPGRASAPASASSTWATIYGVNAEQLPGNVQYIGPRPPAPPAGDPGARQDLLLRLAHRARLRRAGAGQARGRVDAKPGRAVAVESVPLTAGRRLRDVSGTLAELQRLAAEVGDDFLRVTVKAEAPTPGSPTRCASCCRTRSRSRSTTPAQPTPAEAAATGATAPWSPPSSSPVLPGEERHRARAKTC